MAKAGAKTRVSEKPAPIVEGKAEISATSADAVARDLGGKSSAEPENQTDVYRLSVPIDRRTGKIAIDTMREKTKRELLETLSVSGLSGVSASPESSATLGLDDGVLVTMAYHALGMVTSLIATKGLGFNADDVAKTIPYTAEQIDAFKPLTINVMQQFMPALKGKYANAILLGSMLTIDLTTKLSALAELQRAREPITKLAHPLKESEGA